MDGSTIETSQDISPRQLLSTAAYCPQAFTIIAATALTSNTRCPFQKPPVPDRFCTQVNPSIVDSDERLHLPSRCKVAILHRHVLVQKSRSPPNMGVSQSRRRLLNPSEACLPCPISAVSPWVKVCLFLPTDADSKSGTLLFFGGSGSRCGISTRSQISSLYSSSLPSSSSCPSDSMDSWSSLSSDSLATTPRS